MINELLPKCRSKKYEEFTSKIWKEWNEKERELFKERRKK